MLHLPHKCSLQPVLWPRSAAYARLAELGLFLVTLRIGFIIIYYYFYYCYFYYYYYYHHYYYYYYYYEKYAGLKYLYYYLYLII